MKKIYFILFLFILSCQLINGDDLAQISVQQNQNDTINEVLLIDKDNKVIYKSKPKDYTIMYSKIESLFFDSLLYKNEGISLSPCHWELFFKKSNNLSFAFVDLDGINYVLENKLKIKEIIPFNTYQGTLLQNIILESQFPPSIRANTISTYSKEWSNINTAYSPIEKIEIKEYSSILNKEKLPYLPKNTIFTMSDFCNFVENVDMVEKINRDKANSNLYVCIFRKTRTKTSKYDRDDLFFKFEQYINDNGFLQVKKNLLNPYSFNRKRIYIFE